MSHNQTTIFTETNWEELQSHLEFLYDHTNEMEYIIRTYPEYLPWAEADLQKAYLAIETLKTTITKLKTLTKESQNV